MTTTYFVGCNVIILNANKFIIGECEFNIITTSKLNKRFPEYSMTNDPDKVWPGGIVHYVMDTSLGKFWMTSTTCQMHVA